MEDGLLVRYIRKECSLQEAKAVLNWIEASEENKEYFRRLSVVWLATDPDMEFFFKKEDHSGIRKKWLFALSAVASVAVVLIIFFSVGRKDTPYDYESYLLKYVDSGEILLAIDDEDPILISDSMAVITYDAVKKNIQINDDTLGIVRRKGREVCLNTIRVPYGKRVMLYLSDSTHVYLNSGSALVYPSTFGDERREVYLEGEAYFEVNRMEDLQPFLVRTAYRTVEVTGTRFNVSSERELKKFETVLVCGKITVDAEAGALELQPDQYYGFSEELKSEVVRKVDVRNYISWIDGKLKFDRERLSDVLYKVEKVYNVKITLLHPEYGEWLVSGLLDLRNTGEETVGMLMRILNPDDEGKDLFVIEKN